MTASLSSRSASGVRVTFTATVVTGAVQVLTLVVLARLIDPGQYGALAIAISASAITTGFVTNSIERGLIVDPGVPEGGAPSIMPPLAIATAAGIVAAVILLFAQQVVPGTTGIDLKLVLLVMTSHIIASAAISSRVALRQQLRFAPIAVSQIIGQIIGSAVISIVMARAGYGAYAIALALLANASINTSILLWINRRGLRVRSYRGEFGRVFIKTVKIGRTIALEALYGNMPVFMIARLFSDVGVGLYNRAFALVGLPIELLASSMGRVVVSSFVLVGNDKERALRAVTAAITLAAAVITPIAGGLAGASGELVRVALGPEWEAATPLLPVLAVGTWAIMLGTLFLMFAEAHRRFRDKIIIQLLCLAALMPAMWIGSRWGLVGAATAVAAAHLLLLLLHAKLTLHQLGIGPGRLFLWLTPGLGAGIICATLSFIIGRWLDWTDVFTLMLQTGVCGISTLLYYAFFHRELLRILVHYSVGNE